MRREFRRVASRLRRLVAHHTRESPYYRNLTPCERGWYHRATGRGTADDHDDVTIVITTTGGSLLETTLTFLDDRWPVYVIDGSDRCYGLPALHHALENVRTRWGILLDEDALVLDNDRLGDLVQWAANQGYAAVGMPDGGVFPRRVHNPNALNLFFNVLDLDGVRRVWDPAACQRWMDRGSEMADAWPPPSLLKPDVPYLFDDYEPYYCFYFWLADAGLTTGYLDARLHSDGLSAIVLDHAGEPVVVHTWYGREFDSPGGPMRERILDVIQFARGGEDRGARWRGRF